MCDAVVVLNDRVRRWVEAQGNHPPITRLRQPINTWRFTVARRTQTRPRRVQRVVFPLRPTARFPYRRGQGSLYGGPAARWVGRGTGVVFSVLQRVTGVDLLRDLSVFFRTLGGMIDGFTERARRVGALLEDPATTFLIVTAPRHDPLEEAIFFHRNFADQNMMIHFLKNMMIAGGLLQIVHFGAGPVSLDTRSGR